MIRLSAMNQIRGHEMRRSLLLLLSLAAPAPPLLAAETQTYTYDAAGRLIKVVLSDPTGSSVTTEYTHDKANNRVRVKTTGSPNPPQ